MRYTPLITEHISSGKQSENGAHEKSNRELGQLPRDGIG